MLSVEDIPWNRSIALPPREQIGTDILEIIVAPDLDCRNSSVCLYSVYPSICPDIRCVLCDKIKEPIVDILIPPERAIRLVF